MAQDASGSKPGRPELTAFLEGWWFRAEQFRALLEAVDSSISIGLGPDKDRVYIQALREDEGWLVDAVSNNYLPRRTRLSVDAECTMLELGWQAPTGPMPNFFRFYDAPVDLVEVATDIMITFAVVYQATSEGPFSVSPPSLLNALTTGDDASEASGATESTADNGAD